MAVGVQGRAKSYGECSTIIKTAALCALRL